ncbi:fatty acid desaturase family protein [Crateriforma conspicua]|uniref:Fatty acid desaturase n=1 Tax=Crateriforma conspicua TaxID=2527996 RepID=A0A5C5YBT0_9PLAN|nr:fatty acid desaturase [Crateriforma conspicua]QDV61308.1 Fatty acid desaturase [Crateriforma conspicua]TWT72439.1 Fatty acid desaturase [Crateriforma conspicua]
MESAATRPLGDEKPRPSSDQRFSFAQARTLIGDLTRPNPLIYWTDFLVSIVLGHIALHGIFFLPRWYPDAAWMPPAVVALYVVTVLLYMRALMFIHELVHLPQEGFRGFRIAWNALCGIFFFVPSFLYYPHVDHHRRKHYGTEHDGEYLPLSHHGRWMIVGFIFQALVIPILGLARFLIISPICWVFPPARKWVHRHASTMVVDPFYERPDASPRLMRIVLLQEVCCFAWAVWFLIRGGLMRGEWLDPFWLVAYAVGLGVLVLNEFRTLGAHRWTNDEGEMSFEDQLLDSVNYPDNAWITELWGPVGTRFHALHHLFPRIPYHNLGLAHRRLTEGLPADSIYHRTNAHSLTEQIVALWQRAGGSETHSDPLRHGHTQTT